MGRWINTLVALLVLYGATFAVYMIAMPLPFSVPPATIDGLAVFTGGSGRVDTAVDLMKQGFGGPVLISGVHPNVRLPNLTDVSKLTPRQRAALQLDYDSRTTRENVMATAYWATRNHLRQVGIVTSTYHAMRVRVLFRLLAPEVDIVLLPVQPVDGRAAALLREFNKLLVAPLLP